MKPAGVPPKGVKVFSGAQAAPEKVGHPRLPHTRHGEPAVVVVAFRDFQRWRGRQNSLVEFLRESPLQGIELDLRRDKSPPRKVAL